MHNSEFMPGLEDGRGVLLATKRQVLVQGAIYMKFSLIYGTIIWSSTQKSSLSRRDANLEIGNTLVNSLEALGDIIYPSLIDRGVCHQVSD